MGVSLARTQWMPLEAAETLGADLSWVAESIGPRRAGTLYYGAYWGDLNQVIDVMVGVESGRSDGHVQAIAWNVAERTVGQSHVRHHMTSWAYDRRNRVHYGPGDLRGTRHAMATPLA